MAYIINKTNGEQLVIIEDGTLNTDTSLGLLGKNTIGYGEVQNENFVKLLENFAGSAPPSGTILTGQIYFNTTSNQLNVYDGSAWNIVGDAEVSDTEPATTTRGSFWLKTPTQQLYVYNQGWKLVGPESVANFGTTRAVSRVIKDNVGGDHPIIEIRVNNIVIAICSSTFFTIGNENPITGFSIIKSGINLSANVDLKGNVDGNSLTASRLQNKVKINGIDFDGSSDIQVSAASPASLKAGNYIQGGEYNGSTETTWSVDASSAMAASKVVVRDEQGNFAANVITANLIGNVTGNVNTIQGSSQFNNIVAVRVEANLVGNVTGNSTTATKLEFERKINNVVFDGTKDITIKAVSPNPIVPGSFLRGQSYDGTSITSWDVEASSENLLNTIVARDGAGNFSANAIVANSLTGNLTGNVNTNTGNSNFNNIVANQISSNNILGNLTGNASTATKLAIPRAINSVLFDGTQNITIKSSTTQRLLKGQYILGSNFDGSAEVTWDIDASISNQANKLVARDSNGNFSAGTITANLNGNVTGNVAGNLTGNTNGTHTGPVIGTVTGNVQGTLTGNVFGNVQGTASGNISRTGDTLSGRLGQSTAGFHAASIDNISIRTNSGFYDNPSPTVEKGWPVTGSWHHLLSSTHVNDANYYAMQFSGDFYDSKNVYYRATSGNGLTAWNKLWHSGNDGAGSGLDADLLDGMQPQAANGGNTIVARDANGDIAVRVVNGTLNGSATGNVLKTGDSMSGYLTLVGAPVNTNHAATKNYVDTVAGASAFIFTYGQTYSTSGFTNQVGSWNFNRNHFDIFPPAGRTMANFVALIPSIAVIHFAGGVNGDDSLVCSYGIFSDRIRIYVQNTEQRSTPAANWLCIWR